MLKFKLSNSFKEKMKDVAYYVAVGLGLVGMALMVVLYVAYGGGF